MYLKYVPPAIKSKNPYIKIKCDKSYKPVSTILSKLKVLIVMHGIIRSRSLIVDNIGVHPMLEFDGILLCNEMSVLMIVIEIVMNLRRMEFTWIPE